MVQVPGIIPQLLQLLLYFDDIPLLALDVPLCLKVGLGLPQEVLVLLIL